MTSFWNERYSQPEYIYGEDPNDFFAMQLGRLKPGTIILPCEGEGRNAVYAASLGWKVLAFDSSEAGKAKALQLAEKKGVVFDYDIEDAIVANYPDNTADAVAFIYAHFEPVIRKQIHRKATSWLKPGGLIIMEVFNPNQLNNNSGGPKDPSMLCTEEIIREDFADLKIELLQSIQKTLSEGKYHKGIADVVQFIGLKV